MARVKRGVTGHARHKKVLSFTKGHKGQRHRLFRRANESMMHALDYAYRDRRDRKSQFRRLWIIRINAAARLYGTTYSQLINGLTRRHRGGAEPRLSRWSAGSLRPGWRPRRRGPGRA